MGCKGQLVHLKLQLFLHWLAQWHVLCCDHASSKGGVVLLLAVAAAALMQPSKLLLLQPCN
jgi:hypothetical protein